MSVINFSDQSADFSLANETQIVSWLSHIAKDKLFVIEKLNYIFCSDEDVYAINVQYLQHDYYTDIITFDLSEKENTVLADVFISIDRVRDNAIQYNQPFQHELLRVLSHGLLHLIGYNDKTDEQQIVMTKKENECVGLFFDKFV